jgi:transposase-like protein
MGNNRPLSSEERLEIVELLKRGSLSHREIGKRVGRAQSTVSSIAKDIGATPSHRRKRTPAASAVESTYDKQERVNFEDRFIGVLDGMITEGGLSPRDAREIAQAAKVVLDARRSEDLEPEKGEESRVTWQPIGLGDIQVDPNTWVGREMLRLEAELEAGE